MTDEVRKKPGLLGRLFGRDASVPVVADEPALVAVVEPRLSWWQKLKQGLARSSSSIGQGITDLFTKR
jgi:fused signal recognition particle receptor